ncbi:hypothetical protein P4E94_07270 [Pontiellaceae bacterium B12219]|nr:hypothetical protein [Pontiellaceae bacterium B12219]
MKIIAAVIHYNEPEKAEVTYKKLIADGFDHVILFDNGSDKVEPSPLTNLSVEVNNFFGTGIRFLLNHVMLNYDFDYFFYTSTSLQFDAHVPYKQELDKAIGAVMSLPFKVGTLQFTEQEALERFQSHLKDDSEAKYLISQVGEATHFCISRQLLEILKKEKTSFFDVSLIRGWAMDFDLEICAHKHGFLNFRIKDVEVHRDSLMAYKAGKRSETRSAYEEQGRKEFLAMIERRYGSEGFDTLNTLRNYWFRTLYIDRALAKGLRNCNSVAFPNGYRLKRRKVLEMRLSQFFRSTRPCN